MATVHPGLHLVQLVGPGQTGMLGKGSPRKRVQRSGAQIHGVLGLGLPHRHGLLPLPDFRYFAPQGLLSDFDGLFLGEDLPLRYVNYEKPGLIKRLFGGK